MSANLGRTTCPTCGSADISLDKSPYRLISKDSMLAGMWVADATCSACKTLFTAWIGPPRQKGFQAGYVTDEGFYDLSYRSTFSSSPGPGDVPPGDVVVYQVVEIAGAEVSRKQLPTTNPGGK